VRHNETRIGLRDAVGGLLFSLGAEGKSERTIEYYRDLLKHLLKYAENNGWNDNLQAIDAGQLRRFLSWVGSRTFEHDGGNGSRIVRKAKPSTAWPYYRALRRLFNWAIEERYLISSPLATIHFKQPPAPPVQGFTRDELLRLLSVCDLDIKTGARFTGTRNKGMLLLYLDSGLRRAELVNIKLSDLDLENRRIRVVGKGNKVGVVPFSPRTAKALWAWLILRKIRAKTDRLWTTEEGKAFSVESLVTWFKRLKQRAGINSPGGVHRLRHTAALQYLRGARDSFLLQLFLRHEDLTMSRRYTKGLKAEEAIEAHRNGASPVEGLGLG
jgi:site-specific recombinase XerD